MSEDTRVLEALASTAEAARTFRDIKTTNGQWAGVTTCEIHNDLGQATVALGSREGEFSNHAKLLREQRREELKAALLETLGALEAALPGHRIKYAFNAHEDKHFLRLDDTEVLAAVANSWTVHFPLLRRVYGTEGAGRKWVLDMNLINEEGPFPSTGLIAAPDLPQAILRHQFTKQTLGERLKGKFPIRAPYAAAELTDDVISEKTGRTIDPSRVEAEWDRLLKAVDIAWPWPSSPRFEMVIVPGSDSIWREERTCHMLLTSEDRKAVFAARNHVRSAFNDFHRELGLIAPATGYVLEYSRFGMRGDGWQLNFRTTSTPLNDGSKIAAAVAASEAIGRIEKRPYGMRDGGNFRVVEARTAAEAPKLNGWIGTPQLIVPCPLSELEPAATAAEALWNQRRKAPRKRKAA